MSVSNSSSHDISLQKPSGQPPELPPMDEYGNLLPQLLSAPRSGSAGWGVSWITNALSIFKDHFLLWIGIGTVYLIIMAIASAIPFLNLVFSLLSFVFVGGIIKGADAQATGKALRFDHLFSAFSTHLWPLIVLLLLYVIELIIIFVLIIFIFFIGMYLLNGMPSADDMVLASEQMTNGTIATLLLTLLFTMILLFPLMMAIWFAPALIVLHNIRPTEAMKMSLDGSLKNIWPLSIFFLVGPILALLGALFTLGLAVLVLVPIGMITYYTSYRDVWTDQPLSDV
ncbi:BPSS1780 family membrane protein [Psychrobacter sp. B38]|uniref:BPSS1780 family membrane protein n=1 Tax=Psychrobacter sp. B38 TaxID=3143538 RepID=UPI0032110617